MNHIIIIDLIKKSFKQINKYHTSEIWCNRSSEEDSYVIRISWRQGINTWMVHGKIDMESLIKFPEILIEGIDHLIKVRDNKIRDIQFWTNCNCE